MATSHDGMASKTVTLDAVARSVCSPAPVSPASVHMSYG